MIIEVCANSYESAKAAEVAGADRIELCTELSVGGLTPSIGLIQNVLATIDLPVHVLIRPRSGNFTYSSDELDVMLGDIVACRELGCAGVVSGVLTTDHNLDYHKTDILRNAAEGMEFTFHRAFDWCKNPLEDIEQLVKIGIDRLLSSGQQPNAVDGISLLKEIKALYEGHLEVMPGGGITKENVLTFQTSGFEMVHFSATTKKQTLSTPPYVPMHNAACFEEGVVTKSDVVNIREIISQVRP